MGKALCKFKRLRALLCDYGISCGHPLQPYQYRFIRFIALEYGI